MTAIAPRTQSYLDAKHVSWALVPHQPADGSGAAASNRRVPPEWLARSVLLRDEGGYLLAVVPGDREPALERLESDCGRALEPAGERELAAIFPDCDPAAIPPFGAAYGIPTAVDEAVLRLQDVYFEAGKPEVLVRMRGADFAALCSGCARGDYSSGPPPRERPARQRPFAGAHTHVFSLRAFGAGLRRQPEYERNGHAGMLLVKAPELRVVLEAMQPDTLLRTHIVHGPTTLQVLEGALEVVTERSRLRIGESEMAALPRDERREIRAPVASLFLMALGRRAIEEELQTAATRASRPRRVLIVANQTSGGEHLVEAVRVRLAAGPSEFFVLVPAAEARPSGTTWEEGVQREEAEKRLAHALAKLRAAGAPTRGVVGDFYPVRAIHDLLLFEKEDFDEIVLSTFPLGLSEWLKLDLPSRIARRFGIPVTHVVARRDE
jgi:Ala-tRNA(Pro) deacylase